MILTRLSRQKPCPPLSLPTRRRLCDSAAAAASKLRATYDFHPPPSLHPNPQNPNSIPKRKKPKYRPPSSLDPSSFKPIRSDLPFDFRYSYTESSPEVRPIGLRGPKYSPFGPGRVIRRWTGVCAPAVDITVRSVDAAEEEEQIQPHLNLEERRRIMREEVQGEPLSEAERKAVVETCRRGKTNRQVNLGRDGLTHNMLDEIHSHWRHSEAVRIRCMGVPTVDMKNVCSQLEDKTFGRIISRKGRLIVLYRGRNYVPKRRPVIPLMLWKPQEPVYPRLIKTTIDGLSVEETKQMRRRGLAVPALTRLRKNGFYGSLMTMVRDAFIVSELVRIECKGLEKSDCRRIGCKLRDLVPCVLVTFDKEQIVVWRGKAFTPPKDAMFGGEKHGSSDDGNIREEFYSGDEECPLAENRSKLVVGVQTK